MAKSHENMTALTVFGEDGATVQLSGWGEVVGERQNDYQDAPNGLVLEINGVVVVAWENPDDGYRSTLSHYDLGRAEMLQSRFTPVKCRVEHFNEELDGNGRLFAGIKLYATDGNGGWYGPIVQVGTDYSDDYYPTCVLRKDPACIPPGTVQRPIEETGVKPVRQSLADLMKKFEANMEARKARVDPTHKPENVEILRKGKENNVNTAEKFDTLAKAKLVQPTGDDFFVLQEGEANANPTFHVFATMFDAAEWIVKIYEQPLGHVVNELFKGHLEVHGLDFFVAHSTPAVYDHRK